MFFLLRRVDNLLMIVLMLRMIFTFIKSVDRLKIDNEFIEDELYKFEQEIDRAEQEPKYDTDFKNKQINKPENFTAFNDFILAIGSRYPKYKEEINVIIGKMFLSFLNENEIYTYFEDWKKNYIKRLNTLYLLITRIHEIRKKFSSDSLLFKDMLKIDINMWGLYIFSGKIISHDPSIDLNCMRYETDREKTLGEIQLKYFNRV